MSKIYKNIKNINNISHEEWLKIRKNYIGGSDAGAIAGVNKYRSKASVWIDKNKDEIELIDNERMRIGRDLEDYVAKRFSEDTGKKVRRNNFMMVNKEYPFMLANVDREVIGENAVLECKTTGSYSKDQWEDGQIPPSYYCQVQHYMATVGYDKGYIAVLIGNEKFTWYEIPRDEEYIEALIKVEKEFYEDNILKGYFPEPDGSSAYSKALEERFIGGLQTEIELDELENTAIKLEKIKEEKKELEKTQKELEQEIQLKMKDWETATIGSYKVTWKPVISRRFNKKKFEADYPELAEEYMTESKYKRFTFK